MIRSIPIKTVKKVEILAPEEPIIPKASQPSSPPPSPSISKGDIVKLVKGRIQKAKHSNPSGTGMMEA